MPKTTLIVISLFVVIVVIFLVLTFSKSSPAPEVITPTPAPSPTSEPVEPKNISVSSPTMNDAVTSPLTVKGSARVFENVISYRLLDTSNQVLASGNATADAPDVGQFGPFELSITYKKPTSQFGTLEVFTNSAKDGTEIDKVIIFIKFDQ